jgi:hypothetical protein
LIHGGLGGRSCGFDEGCRSYAGVLRELRICGFGLAVGVEEANSNTIAAASRYFSAARAPHLKTPPLAICVNEGTIGAAEVAESLSEIAAISSRTTGAAPAVLKKICNCMAQRMKEMRGEPSTMMLRHTRCVKLQRRLQETAIVSASYILGFDRGRNIKVDGIRSASICCSFVSASTFGPQHERQRLLIM